MSTEGTYIYEIGVLRELQEVTEVLLLRDSGRGPEARRVRVESGGCGAIATVY